MKYTKKHIKAMEETLTAYEKLIADPEGEYEKWRDFGDYAACRLCKSLPKNKTRWNYEEPTCERCILNNLSDCFFCADKTFDYLYNTINDFDIDFDMLVSAAKLRYKKILKHLKKLDYHWEIR